MNDSTVSRYRCFTGHAYSENNLLEKQTEGIQATLWVALRLFEEKKKLLMKLVERENDVYRKRAEDIENHIVKLKQLHIDLQKVTSDFKLVKSKN